MQKSNQMTPTKLIKLAKFACNNNASRPHAKDVVAMNTMEFVFIVKLEMEHQAIFQLRTLLTILQVFKPLSTIPKDKKKKYVPYSCELCGNDSHYGYDCPPQVPFVYNQDLCFNQNFDYFPQTSPSFPQQYPCCENCGGPHETYQCQPMNEDYYHEQNSCYDSNSFGFDQVQPPQYTVNHPIFNSQNELLNSQNEFLNTQNELLNSSNKLMEQMTTLRDLVGQAIQKKEEEKRIAEEQAAKDRSWKIPICYDDDEDNTIAITPVSPIEEPDNSLSMGDKHLDTIPETESDEVIKSSVEDLVPIPSESEGIPDKMCDVPLCEKTTPLEAFKEHSETIIDYNDDSTSSDDDSYENIEYVDASPPDDEIVSLEVVEIVDPEEYERRWMMTFF
ncbi:hypothetical protein Tco_1352118 [Tanacetum coccineum]